MGMILWLLIPLLIIALVLVSYVVALAFFPPVAVGKSVFGWKGKVVTALLRAVRRPQYLFVTLRARTAATFAKRLHATGFRVQYGALA